MGPAGVGPTGSIIAFAGTAAPSGWLVCDGRAVDRTTYADLFATIGELYGDGDGVTTFNVPDLRGRTAIGAGQGAGLTDWALGETTGAETHTLSTAEMPTHSHAFGASLWSEAMNQNGSATYGGWGTANWPSHTTHSGSNPAGGSEAHPIMQPSIAVSYIIKD